MDLYSPFAGLPPPPPPPESETTETLPSTKCGSCFKESADLRCTRCTKTVYCSPACQKSDWTFHKRVCVKPKPKEDAPRPPPPAPASDAPPAAASSSSVPRSSGGGASSSTEVVRDEDLDDDERAALEAVRKTGYKVHWRPAEEEARIRAAIGNVAPKRVDAPSAAAGAAAAPAPVPAPSTAPSEGSAWNSAGTTETRNRLPWLKTRLSDALREGRDAPGGRLAPLAVSGVGTLRVSSGVGSWGDSSADILLARGNRKAPYDLSFSIHIDVRDGGDAPATPPADGADVKPRATLQFLDVNDASEGAPRDVRVTVSAGVVPAERAAALKDALRPEGAAGALVAAIRDVVEAVIVEFKTPPAAST